MWQTIKRALSLCCASCPSLGAQRWGHSESRPHAPPPVTHTEQMWFHGGLYFIDMIDRIENKVCFHTVLLKVCFHLVPLPLPLQDIAPISLFHAQLPGPQLESYSESKAELPAHAQRISSLLASDKECASCRIKRGHTMWGEVRAGWRGGGSVGRRPRMQRARKS